MATDDGTPSLSGTAFVDITVLASSYQIPDWVSPSSDGEIVYIYEVIAVIWLHTFYIFIAVLNYE